MVCIHTLKAFLRCCKQVVGQFLLLSAIVAGAVFVSVHVGLPTLARKEMHTQAAAAFQGLSRSIIA